MPGERDLEALLSTMSPTLRPDEFVFVSFAGAHYGDHAGLEPIASVQEGEGLTLIVPKPNADGAGLDYEGVFRAVSLAVHSSLDAVGLTAAVSSHLAARGISANVVAGFYHDHLFVQTAQAQAALRSLEDLSREHRGETPPRETET